MKNIKNYRVRVFSTISCPYCVTLKEFLKDKNIVFEEVDVAKDAVAREEMVKKSGQVAVPVVDIDGQFIVGFDKAKIVKLLKLKE